MVRVAHEGDKIDGKVTLDDFYNIRKRRMIKLLALYGGTDYIKGGSSEPVPEGFQLGDFVDLIIMRDKNTCRVCGEIEPDYSCVHHIIPKKEGGSDHPQNLMTICGSCHANIHAQRGDITLLNQDNTVKVN